MRVTELCNLRLSNAQLEESVLKVLGKGNKERLVPVGKQVQRLLWHYMYRYRPEPAMLNSIEFSAWGLTLILSNRVTLSKQSSRSHESYAVRR